MPVLSIRPRSSRRRRTAALALLACLIAPASLAQFQAEAGNGNDQDRIARDMVSVLKAYAVYKMGQFDEAFDRYKVIAESGNTQGMLNLANMYAAGEGTEQDYEKALHWYRKAAEAGDANGMFETAQAYEKGLGTEPDAARARHWYEQAADHGNAEAQYALGMQLVDAGDEQAGLSWLRRAATEHGHPASQRYLAAREGGGEPQPVTGGNRGAVTKTLDNITDAAGRRDAAGIVTHVATDARIRVRLPNGSGWDELDREALRELWQETFDRAEDYRVTRRDTTMQRTAARIRVRLPNGSGWDELDREALRELWQETFDRAEDYRVTRRDTTMQRTAAGIRVSSNLDERLASGDDGARLTIAETAIFRIDQGRAVIHDLSLDIRRDNS